MDKQSDKIEILHDIANALSPILNYPNRIKKLAGDMEASLEYLEQIHCELDRQSGRIGEYLAEDPKGQKMLPMLGEICKMERQSLDDFNKEYDRFSRLLKKISHVVTDHQSRLSREIRGGAAKTSKSQL